MFQSHVGNVNLAGVTPVFQPARADWKVGVTGRRFT